MKTSAVVDLVDEPRQVGCHVLERLVGCQVDGLDLERLHKAFRLGVVVRVDAASCCSPPRLDDAMPPQPAGSHSTRTRRRSHQCGPGVRRCRGERATCRRRWIARGSSARTLLGRRWRGPVTTEVIALLGRGACFKAPFSSSISSAWRPTIRSRAAILASYSWIRSAACTSSSEAPASNLPTQMRISWRETSWRLESACSLSPAMNSSSKASTW